MSRLPSRPKPPSFQEIISDLENAGEKDVLFEIGRRNAEAETGAGDTDKGTGGSRGGTPGHDGEDGPASAGRPSSADISSCGESGTIDQSYNKAEHFLQLIKELEDAPQKLDDEVQKLEKLEEEVGKVISSLKASAGSSYIR